MAPVVLWAQPQHRSLCPGGGAYKAGRSTWQLLPGHLRQGSDCSGENMMLDSTFPDDSWRVVRHTAWSREHMWERLQTYTPCTTYTSCTTHTPHTAHTQNFSLSFPLCLFQGWPVSFVHFVTCTHVNLKLGVSDSWNPEASECMIIRKKGVIFSHFLNSRRCLLENYTTPQTSRHSKREQEPQITEYFADVSAKEKQLLNIFSTRFSNCILVNHHYLLSV